MFHIFYYVFIYILLFINYKLILKTYIHDYVGVCVYVRPTKIRKDIRQRSDKLAFLIL